MPNLPMPRVRMFAIAGGLWGVAAVAFHLFMFRGLLPPPAPDPVGVLRAVIDAPFLLAVLTETAFGRASPTLGEVGALSAMSGLLIGAALGSIARRLTRGMRGSDLASHPRSD